MKRLNKQNKNDTCVYRFYDNDNICLYVGITEDFKTRIKQHENDKEWFINVNRFEHSDYMNRNQAKIYEIYYISKLKPIYNNDHINFVDGFNMTMEELEFKEYDYTNKDELINKLMIEICKWYNDNVIDYSVRCRYDDLKCIYNKVVESNDNKTICNNISKALSELKYRALCSIQGSGYNYYIPPYIKREMNKIKFDSVMEYEMCEHDISMISLDWEDISRIDLSIIMCKDNTSEFINKYQEIIRQ